MSNATRILVALVVGLGLGLRRQFVRARARRPAQPTSPIRSGALWLNGLRMTIVPLVVALLITGIAQTAEAAGLGPWPGGQWSGSSAVMCFSAITGALLMPLFLKSSRCPGLRRMR